MDIKFLPTPQQVLEVFFAQFNVQPRIEYVSLAEAAGRVLAENQFSSHSLPVVRSSMMDGIAVKSVMFQNGTPDTKDWISGIDYIRADTGDDFDDCFDAVIKIEDVSFEEDGVLKINQSVEVFQGLNVNGHGSMLQEADALMEKNRTIRPNDLAALAMGGVSEVPVYQKPRVAFIPVGSELIPPGIPLTRGKNIETNSLMAMHMLKEMGAEPICYPIVEDNQEPMRQALHTAMEKADVVIINGGSSKGDEDFSTRLLREEGKLLFHGVAAGPGRPMGIAIIKDKPVINIPGPVLAAFYGLEWCIRPIICRYLSLPIPQRQRIKGTLLDDMNCPPMMEFICMVDVKRNAASEYEIQPRLRGSASMAATMSANALFISPIGGSLYKKGTQIEVELLRGKEFVCGYPSE
jgi:molybdopterin molybdotransferase/putative molybdopterin biosynthesis protein